MFSSRVVSTLVRLTILGGLFLIVSHALVACGPEDIEHVEDAGPTGDADTPDAGDTGDTGDAGDTGEDDPDDAVQCETAPPEPSSDQRCRVEPGDSDDVLLYGTLLAGDDVYEDGTLLIDDDGPNRTVSCAGCDCAETEEAADATVVSCPDSVISPGLINPHDHLTFAEGRPQPHGEERFDHRHDWRRGKRGHTEIGTEPRSGGHREVALWGELRMLLGGATSIAGSTGGVDASGLLRNFDDSDETGGLEGIDVDYRTFPLGDGGFPSLQSSGCDYPNIDGEHRLEDGIYLPHIAEGIDPEARNELHCLSGAAGVDLVRDNTSIIHGIAVDARDVAEIADAGANLVWSPRTNIDLYGNTAPAPLYHRFGVPIALGTDWSTSGSMNMLRELQCADYLDDNHYDDTFDDREIWKMATYNAALSMGAGDRLGRLESGYVADITIFDRGDRDPYRAVLEAEVDDIELVMQGGDPLYGDAGLVEALTADADLDQCEQLDVCDRSRRACVELDTDQTIDEIKQNLDPDAYPLFFCGEPEDEPTCVPSRPDEYDGIADSTDSSGDGVPDSMDNCPDYFNPIRPMDDGRQSDVNGTGLGDVCDPCPLSQDTECTDIDPDDWSGDGVPNDEDNCPFHYNPDQDDTSEDGVGDACSPCPEQAVGEGEPCPRSIYEIKSGDVGPDQHVALDEVLVTASHPDEGVFVQVHPDEDGYQGPEFSGLYVYLGDYDGTEVPQPGDRIDVVGTVADFFGQTQVAAVSSVQIESTGHDLPAPVAVSAADVATGGDSQTELEGVLVEVTDVEVTETDVDPGSGDSAPTREFVVEDSLHVNDFFHLVDPFPVIGDTYDAIAGVLRWANGNSKLEPRSADDITFGTPRIDRFEPQRAFLEVDDQPQPAFDVHLQNAPSSPVTVELAYDDTTVVDGPATLEFDAGQQSAALELEALAPADDPVGVEATGPDGDTVSAGVRTFDETTERKLAEVGASGQTFYTGASFTLVASLNVPAETEETLTLEIGPDSSTTYPSELTIQPGDRTAEFDVTLGDETGVYTAVVSDGDVTETFGFEVFDDVDSAVETFENFDASSSTYEDGSFVGDAGFSWEYRDGRKGPATDAPAIDGTSLIFGSSGDRYVRAEDVPGGISSFSVDMQQAFTGQGPRRLELFVNGESLGTSMSFGSDDGDFGEVFEFSVDDIDVDGEFDMEVRSVGDRQITIDNLEWVPGAPLDPDQFDVAPLRLDRFAPDPSYVEVSDQASPAVELHLAYPALEETTVDLTYGDPAAVDGPAEVVFAPGQSTAQLDVQGLESRDQPVDIEAHYDGETLVGQIQPFDESTTRNITTLDGCSAALLGSTLDFEVATDVPAGENGLTLAVDVQPASAVSTVPDDIELAAGEQTATLPVTFDQEAGDVTVTVDSGDDTASRTIAVTDATPPLVEDFSQFGSDDSGSGYTDGDFTGNNGLQWSFFSADRTLANAIDEPSMLFQGTDSSIETGPIPGGVDSFSVDMKKAHENDDPRGLELYVDGEQRASSQIFGEFNGPGDEVHTFTVDDLGAACTESLELQSAGPGQIVIDNLTWSGPQP